MHHRAVLITIAIWLILSCLFFVVSFRYAKTGRKYKLGKFWITYAVLMVFTPFIVLLFHMQPFYSLINEPFHHIDNTTDQLQDQTSIIAYHNNATS